MMSPEEMAPDEPVVADTPPEPVQDTSASPETTPAASEDAAAPVSDVTAPQFRNAQGQFAAAPVADAPAAEPEAPAEDPAPEEAPEAEPTPEAAPSDAPAEPVAEEPVPPETDAEKIERLEGELAQADLQIENLLGIIALSQKEQEPVPADADTAAPVDDGKLPDADPLVGSRADVKRLEGEVQTLTEHHARVLQENTALQLALDDERAHRNSMPGWEQMAEELTKFRLANEALTVENARLVALVPAEEPEAEPEAEPAPAESPFLAREAIQR
jgi:hypothetical protein